jgi:hypothetical protein
MTDPEREHFVQRIKDLEDSRGRWRVACLAMLGLLLLPVVCGGLLGVAWVPRLERERAVLRAEMEQAREAELRARLVAEEALQQAERERVEAEEAAWRRAPERPAEGKD